MNLFYGERQNKKIFLKTPKNLVCIWKSFESALSVFF